MPHDNVPEGMEIVRVIIGWGVSACLENERQIFSNGFGSKLGSRQKERSAGVIRRATNPKSWWGR